MSLSNPFAKEGAAVPAAPSSVIGVALFASLYAAAEFALHSGLPLDTSVTISWSLLGCDAPSEVQAGFTAFLKCLRDWMDERALPHAWIHVHERGPRVGIHTHLAVHVPTIAARRHRQLKTLRREFRHWARGWARGQAGGPAPRAIRVRGPSAETPWLHWLAFNYLLKGYDQDAVVVSGRNAPHGQAVKLGDLVAFPHRDPGNVATLSRAGWSATLGPCHRAAGRHPAAITLENLAQRSVPAFQLDATSPPSQRAAPLQHEPAHPPFRSRFEDGFRDVRILYGEDFAQRVTQQYAPLQAPAPPQPVAPEDDPLLDI